MASTTRSERASTMWKDTSSRRCERRCREAKAPQPESSHYEEHIRTHKDLRVMMIGESWLKFADLSRCLERSSTLAPDFAGPLMQWQISPGK